MDRHDVLGGPPEMFNPPDMDNFASQPFQNGGPQGFPTHGPTTYEQPGNDFSSTFPANDGMDGPRQGKQLKEKFRLDRERLEAQLNARGESLYRRNTPPPTYPGWGGGPQAFGYSNWRSGAPTMPQPTTHWGGPPPMGYPNQSTFGFQGGQMPTPNPFETNQSNRQTGMMENDHNNYSAVPEGFKNPFHNDAENQNDYTEMDFSSGNNPFGQGFGDSSGRDGKNQYPDDMEGAENSADYFRGENNEFTDEYNANDPLDSFGEDFSRGFGDFPQETSNSFQESVSPAEGSSIVDGSYAATDNAPTVSADLDPPRPRKQLKEKFMKDREELEAIMNAKGDSIYRRACDPIPEHLQQMATDRGGAFGTPGGRKFMLPHELRAQMAFQKLAKAALKATAKGGRRGRAGPRIVFI